MKSSISCRRETEQLISRELNSVVPGFDIGAHASGTDHIHEPILQQHIRMPHITAVCNAMVMAKLRSLSSYIIEKMFRGY